MTSIKGKTALVTGASSGIGKAIAVKLASLGANVILCGRNEQKLKETKKLVDGFKVKSFIIVGDLSNDDFTLGLIEKANGVFNGIDILINNAGMTLNSPFESTSLSDYDKIMKLNARVPYILCQKSLQYLRKSSIPTIINVASVVAHKGYVNQSAYTASKHALLGFTKSLASEVYKENIRVHAICPGGVFTDMVKISRPDLSSEGMILPEDIADIVEFLLTHRNNAVIDEISVHRVGKEPFI